MKYGIVVTTIFDGRFIDEYYKHFEASGDLEEVSFYVVGDLNTDPVCAQRVGKYTKKGLPWFYLDPSAQEKFLKPFPEIAKEIPWKTDNRRNVGFLKAYQDGCDVIISIDDDNYPFAKYPFLKGHSAVGREMSLPTAAGHKKWFNMCSLMKVQSGSMGDGIPVYPRGFPFTRRSVDCAKVSAQTICGKVAVNAGLWAGDPDVDAATRLVTACRTSVKKARDYFLAPQTLMPINTQNTAVLREAIPAYYYVRMGQPVRGMSLDRFGDIFSGYFLQKCVHAVGHRVKLGAPIVDHRRNAHNLYKDLWHELAGCVVIDDMLPLLEKPLPKARNYSEAAAELADRIEDWASRQKGFLWDPALKGYFKRIAKSMKIWVKTCRRLQ